MSSQPLMRTQYRNLSTNNVRGGSTAHGESLIDTENYFLPQAQVFGSSLYLWGVADGLSVAATANQPDLTVSPGVALDAAGHLISLAVTGFAIIDPNADPNQAQNIPTVPVEAGGVKVSTGAVNGDNYLTIKWREVLGQGDLGNTNVMLHAPWLRLQPTAAYQDTGEEIILAKVTLDNTGNVTALAVDGRRHFGLPVERIELRRAQAGAAPALTVGHAAAGELRTRGDGGLEINLLPGGAGQPRQVFGVDGSTGNIWLAPAGGNVGIGTAKPQAGLAIDRGATNEPALSLTSSGPGLGSGILFSNKAAGAKTYGIFSGSDGQWHFTDEDKGVNRLLIDQNGNFAIGTAAPQRTIHVEGSEIHSGGPGGGFSFADRGTQAFVNIPNAGQRWIWYALGGSAHLWSAGDRLSISASGEGGGLDVGRRMRVRQGGDASAGIWFYQTAPQADRAFVGMSDDTHVGFWGNTGAGWGLRMDTSNRNLLFGGDFGRPDGASTLSLFGSRIGDVGNGILFIRSGGGVVAFDGPNNVGIGTTGPRSKLEVTGPATAISGIGGNGLFDSGVHGEGHLGVWAVGRATGILASGPPNGFAGAFWGNVSITGTLSKGGGGFKIDHPLDPANKYLSHSFVESPEMMNAYSGNITTDEKSMATIVLPDYFEALNRDFRYQLTVLGEMAQAVVASQIKDNRFTIRTDQPGVMVSWLVTGVRQDPWANNHRITVEEDKPLEDRDLYLHPEIHNQPESRGLMQAQTNRAADRIAR
jgi:hypothetical protein